MSADAARRAPIRPRVGDPVEYIPIDDMGFDTARARRPAVVTQVWPDGSFETKSAEGFTKTWSPDGYRYSGDRPYGGWRCALRSR